MEISDFRLNIVIINAMSSIYTDNQIIVLAACSIPLLSLLASH